MAIQKVEELPDLKLKFNLPPLPVIPKIKPIHIPDPIFDASVDTELNMLQSLKQSQLNLQSPLIRHLAGTKNKVVYYSQATNGFNNDNLNVTSPSPINRTKYNRIDNMIIITTEELSQSFTIEDDGLANNEITASGFMFPGTDPKSGDMFYMQEIDNNGILYYVTTVEPITALDKTGWQIQFAKHYDQFEPHQLDHLVSGYYIFNFESVGTDTRVVYEHTVYNTHQYITQFFNELSNEFLRRFFDGSRNIIVYHYNDSSIYMDENFLFPKGIFTKNIFDPYLIEFFAKAFNAQRLMYRGYNIFPINPIWIDEDSFNTAYKYSLFNALIKRNSDLITYRYYYPTQFKSTNIKDLSYEKWWYFELLPLTNLGCITIYDNEFIQRIKSNTPYAYNDPHSPNIKYDLIINFINNLDYVPSIHDFKLFKDIDLMDDTELYTMGPLLLYICNWYIHLIGQKTY
jgi:hypothetical protein